MTCFQLQAVFRPMGEVIMKSQKEIAGVLAENGMVLLKNGGALPLKKEESIAAFGRTMYFCFKGGAGSGDVMGREPVQPYDALLSDGVTVDDDVAEFYKSFNAERYETELKYWNRVNREWINSFTEPVPSIQLVENAAKRNKTAVVSLGRSSGEWFDIPKESGGYYLTENELALLKSVTENFQKTVLLLNYCGNMDISFLKDFEIDAVLYTAMGGEQMGNAVSRVLTGAVNPSGKLTDTWGELESYPTHEGFETLAIPYNEGIYVGYRYFDTFGIDPIFPFGFGLSYTTFDITVADVAVNGTEVTVTAKVKNTGDTAGKEVVQIYVSEPSVKLQKAYQQLAAFKKTKLLDPGETERLKIVFDLKSLAAYCEETAEFLLEKGSYYIRVGDSSRNTHIAAAVQLDETAVCKKVSNKLQLKSPLSLIEPNGKKPFTYFGEEDEKQSCKKLPLCACEIKTDTVFYSTTPEEFSKKDDKLHTLKEVKNGEITIEQFVAQLSLPELSNILNGVTSHSLPTELHVGTMARKIEGAAGEIWSDERYGIPACVNADGPAGIRLGGFIDNHGDIPRDTELSLAMTAFPTATTLANSWDEELLEEFGRAVSCDMKMCGLNGWLAPGMNLHRNPLCGRNFEYYSEDPLLSGLMAAATVRGVQTLENGKSSSHYVTVKHLAVNNAEQFRFDSDSMVSERALREIYLRGFEIAVKESNPLAVMNSYNKINGEYTSDSYDLNTAILRDEWGYDGCVMTDWCAKSSAILMPNAGCDLVMPGLKNSEYLKGMESGEIPKAVAQRCACNVLNLVIRTALQEDCD